MTMMGVYATLGVFAVVAFAVAVFDIQAWLERRAYNKHKDD